MGVTQLVSSSTVSCDMRDDGEPNDLDPPQHKKGVPGWAWALIAVAGLWFVCCAGFSVIYIARHATAPKAEYTKLTAEELGAEWKRNPAAAANKYSLGGVEFEGTLKEISSNLSNQTYIDVRDRNGQYPTHIFVIRRDAKRGLEKCVVGKRLVVKARATGQVNEEPWLEADEIRPAE